MPLNLKDEVLNLWHCFALFKALVKVVVNFQKNSLSIGSSYISYKDPLLKSHHIERKSPALSLFVSCL